jgi:hypothetical protein
MRALQIELNGQSLAVAGSNAAVLLSAGISLSIHENGGTLDVSGMEDLGNDVRSHLSWVEMIDLAQGDRVTVKFVEVAAVTAPSEARRTDSPQYAADQAAYEDELRDNPPTPRVLERKQPGARLALYWNADPPVAASFESGREFISCSFSWNSFRPDRCRVTLNSFSQVEALGRTGGRDWFSGILNVGEACAIELEA